MEKRVLGQTGRVVSVLGLGGFHLLELSDKDAVRLMETFLDEGGDYMETAAQYGDGEAERKVGLVMERRRNECFLASKCHFRTATEAAAGIDGSLRRLKTDYIDLLFLHHVQSNADLDLILGPDGALEAFTRARDAGKIGHIGITGHGVPDVLIRALMEYEFDAVMTGFNFLDRFNFPRTEDELIPLARERGTGIVAMKVLGDGLLWEYPEQAIRYVLSLPVDVAAVGFNTIEMMMRDIGTARDFRPMDEEEKEELFTNNPVLGNYVCRLCGACVPCPENIDIPEIFRYEGWFDRQLRDRVIRSAPDFALRDRVRFWFENMDRAREAYARLEIKADKCTRCGECVPRCPYGIDIIAKLEHAHYKLTRENVVTIPISG